VVDGVALHLDATHHLVFDLDKIPSIEKVGRGEQLVVDPVWTRIQAAALLERIAFRVGGGALCHGRLPGLRM
jgi:hypothetical protein